MKLIKQAIALVIIVIAGVLIFRFFYDDTSKGNEFQNRQIEVLEYENNTLKKSNVLLDEKIELLRTINDCLITQIDKEQEEIQKLKNDKNDKISAIDSFNDDELYLYFTRFNTKSTGNRK